ncbi:MAG: preprotein translocase subunit SecA [Planctomycetota bacterium]|jgi:preprotein translocase subunit SecA
MVGTIAKKVFGTRNERLVKRYLRIVDQVSAREPEVRNLTDQQLRDKTREFQQRVEGGERAVDMIPEVFAVAREAMDRNVGIRNIFNPAEEFDPDLLEGEARHAYDEVKKQIDSMEPLPPEGEVLGASGPVAPWLMVDIPVVVYEAVRKLHPESRPPFRARPFDVQIIGAMVLYEGRIAEMKTGEGKTIVAPLSTYLSVLEGKQVHVVTVNEYLVQRDRDWTFPFFRALGLTVGAIHPQHMQHPAEKAKAYDCNVVYGTTSEFGFDYLRDNMKLSSTEQVQKRREVAIVDEVDSTLIDEARTPLIISGAAHQNQPRYELADRLALYLLDKQKQWNTADQKVQSCLVEISGLEGDIRNARDKSKVSAFKEKLEAAKQRLPGLEHDRDQYIQYYEVEMDKKKATLTHDGIAEAQKEAGLGSFYVGDNIDIPHLLEQSIRAHTVYQRDRDYVVAPDEDGQMSVVIVDQNTGRKMPGRQWSDGLHQAVEAKEHVPIKQETQTMATITIQNFFKLYEKLAGMTGTADTEATEFYEIYKLDVVVIPTNVPVIRDDHNDLVFMSGDDKWGAIVDEIKAFHDVGRPILVGTTSVEKSEQLSEMLTRRHNIKHQVLNAKQHEREAEFIAHAGELGAVMIATNMAGRGTDIKLGHCPPADLVEHWKRRGICPRDVTPEMAKEQIISKVYRQIAPKVLGLKKGDVEAMDDETVRLSLLRKWYVDHCWGDPDKADKMSAEELATALDESGSCLLHRLRIFEDVEDLGGLHVIGTERHESRRIDNQLRGRSGRQGDKGSSRFFLSLEDDLMKMFAGPTTLKVLSRLGMKEGDAIEHPMLTKSVGRAQRKVEERNFLIRKNILEYDEIMDVQRHEFYGMRQDVLEGRQVKELIFEFIDESVQDAVFTYLDANYTGKCIGEWVREQLNVTIDPDRASGKDREDLHRIVTRNAKEDAGNVIRVTIGEYLTEAIDLGTGAQTESRPEDWDYKGLADWAKANYKAELKVSHLREMNRDEIIQAIEDAAVALIDSTDLSPLDQYLVPDYGAKELAKWASGKLATEFKPEDFSAHEDPAAAAEWLMGRAREAYHQRELRYPVEFALEMTAANFQQNPQAALQQFCTWVRARYELDWTPASLPSSNPQDLGNLLLEEAKKWDETRIADRADRAVTASGGDPEKLDAWFREQCGILMSDEEKRRAADDPQTVAEEKLHNMLRAELMQFERWVLLQILDQAWKDHLYAMDQLRESIGLRSFSQRDPRIEFKREGARLFEEMHQSIRDKVTDLVFKAKLTPRAAPPREQAPRPATAPVPASARQAAPVPAGAAQAAPQPPRPQPAQPAFAAAAAAAAQAGTAQQQRDLEAAASATRGEASAKRKRQPVRAAPTVGRNEPCPCGSGKKYKQCCGKRG